MTKVSLRDVIATLVLCLTISGHGDGQTVQRIGNAILGSMNSFSARAREVVDLVFLVDESGSLTKSQFDSELEFIRNILEHFSVAPLYTQVGVITFGNDAKTHISLDVGSKLDKCEFIERLGKIGYRGGMTNMNEAFYLAKQNLDRVRNVLARGSLQVVFLLSDGYWNNGGDPKPLVDAMKRDNIEFVAVGVGWWQKSKLNALASSDKSGKKLVYDIKTFKQFADIARYFHKGQQKFEYRRVEAKRCGTKCASRAFCSCDARGGREYKCVCPKGSHVKREGPIFKCARCSLGTYSVSDTTEDRCSACQSFTTTINIGSTTPNDCICKTGYTNIKTAVGGNIDASPPCKQVTCPQLSPKANSFITGQCLKKVGSICQFDCDQGFKIRTQDINSLECKATGRWNGEPPRCEAITCPTLKGNSAPNASPWICTNSMGFAHNQVGTVCKALCHQGYRATGSTTRKCNDNGMWSGSDLFCDQIFCSPLTAPPDGSFAMPQCTQNPTAGMSCTLQCRLGYRVAGTNSVVCKNDGTWDTQHGSCKDVQAPIIDYRTGSITKNAALNSDRADVSWEADKPRVRDNSNETPKETLYIAGQEIQAGGYTHTFEIGQTTVEYKFTDSSGNVARFDFTVKIIDAQPPSIRCPKVPPVVSAKQPVNVSWPLPEVSDNSGQVVQVTSSMDPGTEFYWGRHNILYTARDASGNHAHCSFTLSVGPHDCPELHRPINGALACDVTGYGEFCIAQCQNPYDFNLPDGMTQKPHFYVCGGSGEWTETIVPDCTRYRDPEATFVMTMYYNHSCPDPRAQQQIKENAVAHFKTTPFYIVCNCNVTTDNFNVLCGVINTTAVQGTQTSPRGKRSTIDASFINELKRALENSALRLGFQVGSDFKGDMEKCPPGVEYKAGKRMCAECSKGYFQNMQLKCEKCPKGQYSEEKKQVTCIKCPDGQSTLHEGSFNRTNCTDLCKQGFYSDNGLNIPDSCSPCPADTYSDARGQVTCKPCPRNTHTARLGGADDRTKCKGACPAGTSSVDGLQPCKPCPKNTYQSSGRSTKCLPCPQGKVTVGKGKNRVGDCIDLNECLSNPCQNGARCQDGVDDYFCACQAGFAGKNCEVNINECASVPCMNGATCQDGTNRYTCVCSPGYTGHNCAVNVNECSSTPCHHGGTCVDKANGYTCLCLPGFSGSRCEINVNECAGAPCQNGGDCVDLVNGYRCICPLGYSGHRCGKNSDDCKDVHCLNNGTCIDGLDKYQCHCSPGFTGRHCETNINECASSPCSNGAVCNDALNKFICKCKPYYSGPTCGTRESSCFGVNFNQATELDYVSLYPSLPFVSMSSLTVEFWMQSSDSNKVTGNYGTPLSYGSKNGDSFTIFGYTNFVLAVNGEEAVTGVHAADGSWHKICATWRASDGRWKFYKDGVLKSTGRGLSQNKPLPGGGHFILGQKINGLETFSPVDTFKGNLHGVRLWDRVLDCAAGDLPDESVAVAWPDFFGTIEGRLGKTRSILPTGVTCST